MFLTVNGIRVHYDVSGAQDGPWITLAHALATNMDVWTEVAAALGDRYRVLRYDLRGHGQTEAVPGPYAFPMLIRDITELWDALEIKQSHWAGLSIGGMIGYGLGIAHSERLLSIIACDSRSDAPPDYAAYFQSRIDKARAGGMAGVVEPTIERWFTAKTCAANPPVLDRVRAMIRTTDPVGHEGCCEALKTLSFGARLGEISTPTLVLGGDQDKGAPPESLAEVASNIPNAEHAVIPDAGHITALENPAAFLSTLESFLSKH